MPIGTDKVKQKSTILILGHEGHGKTTLATVITKVLSSKSKTKATSVEEMDHVTSVKIQGKEGMVDVKLSRAEVESGKRSYTFYDFETDADLEHYAEVTGETIDGAVLVVDVIAGQEESTIKQVNLIKDKLQNGAKFIVFLNKTDLAEDADQIEVVELTIKDSLTNVGIDTEKLTVYRGSASSLLESNDRKSQKPILDLMKGVDKLPAH